MKLNPNPKQTFLILSMLFGETPEQREPALSKAGEAKDRKPLVEAGLLRVEKRGRSSHVVLQDDAWDFVLTHLGAELPKTPTAGRVLRAVLARVKATLENSDQSLADFVNGGASDNGLAPTEVSDEQIRAACLSLSSGETRKRVKLRDLRARLAVSRDELDKKLLAMQQAGRLVLFKLDNPAEIDPEDEKAALSIAGQPRHLVYLEA